MKKAGRKEQNACNKFYKSYNTIMEQQEDILDPLNITQMDEFFEALENGEIEY